MRKILNKCPVCGGKLEYNMLMQYTNIYAVNKSGKLSSRRIRKEDNGSLECGFICCENADFFTDADLHCMTSSDIKIWQEGEQLFYDDNSDEE